ncbi:hypothetical protein PILCRDRAFT_812555 [Piloderma croceum F 1598]|uniref:Uncharacterized protein n=1 Tax=Piloderma croceum (strain F 1598) TaxID=765440 RepID=A0A0C3GDG5_PILCF|nr:hypothetical protein PILCRDRAFT_812555 [Piloderma croceum F 1598]
MRKIVITVACVLQAAAHKTRGQATAGRHKSRLISNIPIRQSVVLIVWIWLIPLWVKTETISSRGSKEYMRKTSQRLVYSFTWPFISVKRVNRDEYTKSEESFREQRYPTV